MLTFFIVKLLQSILRVLCGTTLLFAGMLGGNRDLAPAQAPGVPAQSFVLDAHKLFFQGKGAGAMASYRMALRRDPENLDAWINGAVLLCDLGEPDTAVLWYRRALTLRPDDPKLRTALGELLLRRHRLGLAAVEIDRVLALQPAEHYAWVARGQIAREAGRKDDAIAAFEKAVALAPQLTIAHYWLAKARESAGQLEPALKAYDQAVIGDSYFTRARQDFALALARAGYASEAADQAARLIDIAPNSEVYQGLYRSLVRGAKTAPRKVRAGRAKGWTPPLKLPPEENFPLRTIPPVGRVPMLRIGIGTNSMGRSAAWRGVRFSATSRFTVYDKVSGRRLAYGAPEETWEIRAGRGRPARLELLNPAGQRVGRGTRSLKIQPRSETGESTFLKEPPPWNRGLERRLKGEIELTLLEGGIKVVNVVDLESYTHGVLSAELPVTSPMEALKAQAVLARTHALYISGIGKRHVKDGYTLCDDQHCQVYRGVAAETGRSRSVVDATRGRVVTYHGAVANVLYSADCGGHSQSASEITGWGDLPYFKGVPDVEPGTALPDSPWALRQWLREIPAAYCGASAHTHPSHFRWTRVVSAEELGKRLDQGLAIGKLKGIVPLRRASSGHLNAVLVRGSKGQRTVTSEIRIRSLFGVGSQRSSLFIVDTKWDAAGRPENFVFYGGGWGHGVGFCQSGATGRAIEGQSYGAILKAYYHGIEIGHLRY